MKNSANFIILFAALLNLSAMGSDHTPSENSSRGRELHPERIVRDWKDICPTEISRMNHYLEPSVATQEKAVSSAFAYLMEECAGKFFSRQGPYPVIYIKTGKIPKGPKRYVISQKLREARVYIITIREDYLGENEETFSAILVDALKEILIQKFH